MRRQVSDQVNRTRDLQCDTCPDTCDLSCDSLDLDSVSQLSLAESGGPSPADGMYKCVSSDNIPHSINNSKLQKYLEYLNKNISQVTNQNPLSRTIT